MSRLSNTPRQTVTFDLERRKSYGFRCNVLHADRRPMDLTGCTLRFVVKRAEFDNQRFDDSNLIVNTEATLVNAVLGEAEFNFQAAELDAPPDNYWYSLVLWTAEGYSAVLLKGVLNLHPNTDSSSVGKHYPPGQVDASLELYLRGYDTINVVSSTLTVSQARRDIVALGNPTNPATLDARAAQLVAAASEGMLFVSLDQADGVVGWRKINAGWVPVEQEPVSWARITGKPGFFTPTAHYHSLDDITGVSSTGKTFLHATNAVAMRNAIGAGTSNLALGTTADTAAPGNHSHTTSDINGISALARTLLNATSATQMRSVIGAGTSSLQLGVGSTTAAAGNHTHDDRYAQLAHNHTLEGLADVLGGPYPQGAVLTYVDDLWAAEPLRPQWSDVQNKPSAFPPATHTHTIADVDGLQTELNQKAALTHPHQIHEIANLTTALNNKAPLSHTHPVTQIDATGTRDNTTFLRGDGTWAAPAASAAHTHPISDVTNLQTVLNSKAGTSHSHFLGTLLDVDTTGVTDGMVLTHSNGDWVAAAPSGGGGGGGTSYVVTGPGRPDIPATTAMTSAGLDALPFGYEYRSTNAPQGALVWRKVPLGYPGRSANGWVCTEGNTGWRNITVDWQAAGLTGSGHIYLSRTPNAVHLNMYYGFTSPSVTVFLPFFSESFRPGPSNYIIIPTLYGKLGGDLWTSNNTWSITTTGGDHFRGNISFSPSSLLWPTSLPGTPV